MRVCSRSPRQGWDREGVASKQGTIQRVPGQQAEPLTLVMGRREKWWGELGGQCQPEGAGTE